MCGNFFCVYFQLKSNDYNSMTDLFSCNVVSIFRWFKFTLKPPNRITSEKLRLAIWDTSFWTFWVKFGHNGP